MISYNYSPLHLALLVCLFVLAFQISHTPAITFNNWIDGTPFLIERSDRILIEKSDVKYAPSVQSPQIGEQKRFYAVDFSKSGRPYFVDATCRAVGKFCYIFVENTQWQKGQVTNTGVARIKRAFDDSTPANDKKGIYQIQTENLGVPPDEIDLDPKIYILILDIPDVLDSVGNYVAGYFEPMNQKRGVLRDPISGVQFRSNEVEMIYLDSNPLDIESITAREILAHEFQHLIHWRYDPNEELWINEGCSEFTSLFLCGYGTNGYSNRVREFERNPEVSLVHWKSGMSNNLANYGASYLWILYLYEHYGGVSTISSLIANANSGIDGVNAVLLSKGYSGNFGDIFSDWKIANFLDDETFENGRYGYKNLDINVRYVHSNSTYPMSKLCTTQSWSARYIEFSNVSGIANLVLNFNANKSNYEYDVKIISMKNENPIAVEDMSIDAGKGSFYVSHFGYRVDKVVMVPDWRPRLRGDFDDTVNYVYSADSTSEVGIDVAIVPNAINSNYVDIIVYTEGNLEADIPKIKVSRLGKTIINEQVLQRHPRKNLRNAVYFYRIFVPPGWNRNEVKWEIYYLGRSFVSGDLNIINKG